MEGVRNFIGNLINANFDSNDKEKINNARESGRRLENYYDEKLSGGNKGKTHTMKIRVVGDQASMWVDDASEPYVCTLTDYDGGYISLVSTVQNGFFDNLKITRLNAQGEPETADPDVAAKGNNNVAIDTGASTELTVPVYEKPEDYKDSIKEPGTDTAASMIPAYAYAIGGAAILLSVLAGTVILVIAVRRKRKDEEKEDTRAQA